MKRFYNEVSVAFGNPLAGEAGAERASANSYNDAWRVLLDSKALKTPKRALLALPTAKLAEAVADEWRTQAGEIDPTAMALTKLGNTAIDLVVPNVAQMVEKILVYVNDHLCYRAAAPEELVALQTTSWNPMLDWAAERFGARLTTIVGMRHVDQPAAAVEALRAAVGAFDPFVLAGLNNAVTILGSLVLGLAIVDERLPAEEAFALSQLDERYQAAKWGEDRLATARVRSLFAELSAAARFVALARG